MHVGVDFQCLWSRHVCWYYTYVTVVYNNVYILKSFSWPISIKLGLALLLCIGGCMWRQLHTYYFQFRVATHRGDSFKTQASLARFERVFSVCGLLETSRDRLERALSDAWGSSMFDFSEASWGVLTLSWVSWPRLDSILSQKHGVRQFTEHLA